MAGLVTELIDVLNEESVYYDSLIELSKNKKDYIIHNNTDAIKEINNQENILIGKIQRLERNRLSLITDIANVLNEKESNITLTSLANTISGQPEAIVLSELAQRLKNTLDEIKELNEQNRTLIQNALEYIDFSINVIRSTFDTAPAIYSSTGEEIPTGGKSLFDVRN